MAKSSATRETREVVLQIPDLGLSKDQIASLKKSFKNEVVSTMGRKTTARPVVVVVQVRVRVIVVAQEF